MNEFNYLFIGIKLKKAGERISSQIKQVLEENNIHIDLRTLWLMSVLSSQNTVSINKLAALLTMTHPAIVQIVNNLKSRNWLELSKSKFDKRVTDVNLSDEGKAFFEKILPLLNDINYSLKEYVNESSFDFRSAARILDSESKSQSIKNKIKDSLKEKFLKQIKIVPYKKKYKRDFKSLNYEWLMKYFTVEEKDKAIILNPDKEIIKNGGEIFFALKNDEVIGTCAMIKKNDEAFELAKMAVSEKYRGKHIGEKLALTCIGYAVTQNATKIILSTNNKLIAAVNLYRKLGFTKVDKEINSEYKRKLIHMELNLT